MARFRKCLIDLRAITVREFFVGLDGSESEESEVRWFGLIDTNWNNVEIRITTMIDESSPIAVVTCIDEGLGDVVRLMFIVE